MQSRNVSEDSITVDSPRILTPRKALNPAFRKVKPERSEIEAFKTNLSQLLNQTENSEHEEHHKNNLITFLKNTWYHPNHFINTKGRSDMVIHTGKKSSSPVGVLLEAKKPGGSPEMVRKDDLNRKALHELLLYYLRERISEKNLELKYLVATDVHQWFIFDAGIFEKLFARDKALVKRFEDFTEGRLAGTDTSFFYSEIASPAIASVEDELEFTWFDLSAYSSNLRSSGKSSDAALVSLYKVLSPEHLLKLPFVNDSNTLDRSFYAELLHIIGLEEVKEQGKHLIRRKSSGKRNSGSLLESAIYELNALDKIYQLNNPKQYGDTHEERLFNVSL